MTHILFVSTSFPDEAFQKGQEAAGGFVADFALTLAQRVNVTVVAPSGRTSVEQNGRLTIHRFAVPSLPLSLLKPHNPAHWLKIINTLQAGQQTVMNVVQETAVDHIFALWALPSGYWAYRASQKHGIPYSIWALGSDIWSLGRIPIIKNVLRNVLRHSQNRFADGYLLADDVKRISGLDCQFLPSSRKLTPTKEKIIAQHPPYKLAFLGRWHPNKGVDLLMDSLKLLQEDTWKRIESVQICGGGPLEEGVKTAVSDLQHAGYPIMLKGYLNQKEATDLFSWADYVLLPSRIESIPVIFSDALQCHVPIIGSPVGDIPRLMTDYSIGVLANDVSANGFKHAIEKAIHQSPAVYTNGIKQANKLFNIEQAVIRFLNTLPIHTTG